MGINNIGFSFFLLGGYYGIAAQEGEAAKIRITEKMFFTQSYVRPMLPKLPPMC